MTGAKLPTKVFLIEQTRQAGLGGSRWHLGPSSRRGARSVQYLARDSTTQGNCTCLRYSVLYSFAAALSSEVTTVYQSALLALAPRHAIPVWLSPTDYVHTYLLPDITLCYAISHTSLCTNESHNQPHLNADPTGDISFLAFVRTSPVLTRTTKRRWARNQERASAACPSLTRE
ncbi:hypothetical protein GQ53DRAFT_223929 [Thozetella sp. PMI_491]|nr:hypothetical protein GQ53DRAFT_223929 [Thozetella sp. PMI_491]